MRTHPFNMALQMTLLTPLMIPSACLWAADRNQSDEQAIVQLEQRAERASPRDQCLRYTELVSAMTDLAGKQMLDGDTEHASAMFEKIKHYAELIHAGLANDPKRVKDAQMIMHRTTYRLDEYLHQASSEDRATLQATLNELNQVQDELLTQVFKH